MTNYTDNPQSCRVDFFKPSGKWYATDPVIFDSDTYRLSAQEAFEISLQRHLHWRMDGMTAVCLHPYVEYPFPVMLVLGEEM